MAVPELFKSKFIQIKNCKILQNAASNMQGNAIETNI